MQKYEDLLKDDVPPQKLSIESELNSNQKKLIIDTLLSGSVEIHKSKKNQSEDNYELMRKTMLILVGDIVGGRNSRVKREFASYLTSETESKIREQFSVPEKKPEDDINVSYDQIQGIEKLIRDGLAYPEIKDSKRGAVITRRWHSSTNWLWRSSGASTKIELSEPEKEEIIPN